MLLELLKKISTTRKHQLIGIFLLMLVGAVAELMTLGAVVPFIAVMTDVNVLQNYQIFRVVEEYTGVLDNQSLRLYVAIAFAGTAILTGLIRIVLTWSSHSFVYGLGNDIATRTYENILRKPYKFHIGTNSSKLVGSFNNIQLLIENVIFHVMRASVSIVLALSILAALVFIAPGIVLLAMAGFGVIFLAARLTTGRFLKRNSIVIAEMQSKRIQAILEGIGSIRDIIIARTQSVFTRRFHEFDRRFQSAHAINESLGRIPRFVVEALGMATIAFITLLLTDKPGSTLAALPILGALALGAQKLLPLFQDIFEAWAHSTGYRDIMEEVLGYLDEPETESSIPVSSANRNKFENEIRLDNVTFQYAPQHPPVLKNASLTIPKGAVVGIIGETGSGKSSLTDIILGLLKPTSGSMKIDGKDVAQTGLSEWHDQIAHVPQAVFLQDSSIASNIALGVQPEDIDIERVREAAKLAKLDKFISGLSEGFETQVGDRGARLSGGQIQRIGIARALYKGAEVLVFDEATSALDTTTEASVMNALREIAVDRTIIIVAHRVSTLSYCDMIIEIKDGQILNKPKSKLQIVSDEKVSGQLPVAEAVG